MKTIILNQSASASNTKKASINKSEKSILNDQHKTDTRSIGAICRHIDKLVKQGKIKTSLKPDVLELLKKSNSFKIAQPFLNDKEKQRKLFSVWTMLTILNRAHIKPTKTK